MQGSVALADTSTVAAIVNQRVLVMERGRFWVLINSAAGIAPGIAVSPSTTAGRVLARTTAIDTFNRIVGRLVDTGIVSKAALADIRIR
jgi:hypothetical protein